MPTAPPTARDARVDAQVFWFRYHKEIIALIALVIIASVAFAGYRLYANRRDAAAAELLAKAKTPAAYQQVIAQYPGAPAAASAYLLLGQAQRHEKKFAESNQTLQSFVQKQANHELTPAAKITMAANDESLGRTDEALSIYQQVANMDAPRLESFVDRLKHLFKSPPAPPKNYAAPYAMISQVRLLKAKGQNEQARQICEKILTEHSDSRWAGEALRQLRELTPKEASAPPPGVDARSTSSPAPGSAPPLLARPSPAAAPSAPPKPK